MTVAGCGKRLERWHLSVAWHVIGEIGAIGAIGAISAISAISAIDRPDPERQSDWFYTRLAQQFDRIIHIDDTRAVEPLDLSPVWRDSAAPEKFSSSIQSSRKCDENERD